MTVTLTALNWSDSEVQAIKNTVIDRLGVASGRIASIANELNSICYDITTRDDFISSETTITTVDGTKSYAVPVDEASKPVLRAVRELYISGGNRLTAFPYAEYRAWLDGQETAVEGEPEEYVVWNDKFWFRPVPDDAYTIQLDYYKFHDYNADVNGIELPARFREVIIAGVLSLLWGGQLASIDDPEIAKMATNEYVKWTTNYERGIEAQQRAMPRPNQFVQYRDLG